jgi:DNA integrity scanning protein DisA with diadenylate cyclase activity
MQNKLLLKNLSLIGYIGLLASIAGFYGYYLPYDDALLLPWILWAVASSALLGYKNYKVYRATKSKLFVLDVLFTLVVLFLPSIISLPGGLSIVLTIIVGAVFAVILINITFHPWKKET